MEYKEEYEKVKRFIKDLYPHMSDYCKEKIEGFFSELKESEDERIIEEIKFAIIQMPSQREDTKQKCLAWLEKQGEPQDKGEISDGYHTFNELYYYRMLYNAAFFNMLPKDWVHKSKRHNDGEECFGGGWFIVMANLPTGQISNHYELKDWDLFQIPEKEVSDEWDGHSPQEAAERIHKFLLEKQGTLAMLSEEEQSRFAKGVLTSCALSFINYLDAHKYEGKMCVSNGECECIKNAFHNYMWDRLHRYYCKYIVKPQGKSALEAINEEKVDNANKVEPKDYNGIDPHFGKPIDKEILTHI